MINEQVTEQEINGQEPRITEPSSLVFHYQAENNIKIVLNSNRISDTERSLFIESLRFMLKNSQERPSVKRLWAISGLSKTESNRKTLSRLLCYFKNNGIIEIKTTTHIKPLWVKMSNGSLIKNRYSEIVRYINQVN